eukprot:2051573-Amphidinium_carterae.1
MKATRQNAAGHEAIMSQHTRINAAPKKSNLEATRQLLESTRHNAGGHEGCVLKQSCAEFGVALQTNNIIQCKRPQTLFVVLIVLTHGFLISLHMCIPIAGLGMLRNAVNSRYQKQAHGTCSATKLVKKG